MGWLMFYATGCAGSGTLPRPARVMIATAALPAAADAGRY
jgi:hypothetical protein